jgi:O-antigen/teichoic acid export membrane protein
MFTSIYIARVLSPVHYGEYSVLLTVSGMFQVFAFLGLPATVTREVARNQDKSKSIFRASIWAFSGGLLIACFFLLIYLLFVTATDSAAMVVLLVLSLFAQSSWGLFESVAFGMQRMEYSGLINLVFTCILFVAYVIIPKEYISVELVFMVSVFSQLLKSVFYYLLVKKNQMLTGEMPTGFGDRVNAVQIVKISLPFLVLGIFSMLSNQLPILFLNFNAGAEQVAFFNTANKLIMPINLFITTAMTALFPNLSRLYHFDKDAYVAKIKMGFTFIAILGVFGAVTVSLFSTEIVSIVYGKSYSHTGVVIAYQVWFTIAFAFFCFFGGILSSADKQKTLSYLSIAYSIVSVPILWIGSHYGAESLALAFIIAAMINMSYHWYFMQKMLASPFTKTFTVKLILIVAVPFMVSLFIPENLNFIYRFVAYISIILIIIFTFNKRIRYAVKNLKNIYI